MFGNTRGWIIASVVLLLEVLLIVWLFKLDDVSSPTEMGTNPANLAAVNVPFDMRSLVQATNPTDAGPLYRQAVREMSTNKLIYERFAQRPDAQTLTTLDAFKFLLEARTMSKAKIFADHLDEVLRYNQPDREGLNALDTLGKGLLAAGTINMVEKPEEARKYFEAAFNLGFHLYEERIVFQQIQIGMNLMAVSADGLAGLPVEAGGAGGASEAKFKAFRDARATYFTDRVMPIWGVITAVDQNKIGRHSGDIFAFAKNSQDRVWKVEAILKLGRMRYSVGTGGRAGDQKGADRLLREIIDSPSSDPVLKKAAQLALDLTVEQYRTLQ